MNYKILHRAMIMFLLVILAACTPLNNPDTQVPENVRVRSTTKWAINPKTNTKIDKLWYKEFDLDGNLSLTLNYDKGIVLSKSLYSYNQEFTKEDQTIFNQDGSTKNTQQFEYYYNLDKKLIKKIIYNDSSKVSNILTYEYDVKGNVVIRKDMDVFSNKEITTEYDYKYNPSGEVVKRIIKSNGNVISDSLSYNTNNNQVDILGLDNLGEVKTITTFLYNQYGKIIYEIESDSFGNKLKKYSYEYIYY